MTANLSFSGVLKRFALDAVQPTQESPKPARRATHSAIGFGIASALLFALSNIALRKAGKAGALDVALIRSGVFALALAPISLLQTTSVPLTRPARTTVVLGLFTATSILTAVTWFLGLQVLPLATATSLFSLKAPFSVLGAALLIAERLSSRRVIAVLIGLVGGTVLLNPGQPHLVGAALVLCAAASSALSGIFYAQLVRLRSPTRTLFASSLIQLLILMPFAVVDSAALPAFTLAMAIVSALLSIGVMYTLAWAYRGADVGLIASLEYLRLPFAAVLAFLFFGEHPVARFFVGSAIIIVGAALADPYLKRRSEARQPELQQPWELK